MHHQQDQRPTVNTRDWSFSRVQYWSDLQQTTLQQDISETVAQRPFAKDWRRHPSQRRGIQPAASVAGALKQGSRRVSALTGLIGRSVEAGGSSSWWIVLGDEAGRIGAATANTASNNKPRKRRRERGEFFVRVREATADCATRW